MGGELRETINARLKSTREDGTRPMLGLDRLCAAHRLVPVGQADHLLKLLEHKLKNLSGDAAREPLHVAMDDAD